MANTIKNAQLLNLMFFSLRDTVTKVADAYTSEVGRKNAVESMHIELSKDELNAFYGEIRSKDAKRIQAAAARKIRAARIGIAGKDGVNYDDPQLLEVVAHIVGNPDNRAAKEVFLKNGCICVADGKPFAKPQKEAAQKEAEDKAETATDDTAEKAKKGKGKGAKPEEQSAPEANKEADKESL